MVKVNLKPQKVNINSAIHRFNRPLVISATVETVILVVIFVVFIIISLSQKKQITTLNQTKNDLTNKITALSDTEIKYITLSERLDKITKIKDAEEVVVQSVMPFFPIIDLIPSTFEITDASVLAGKITLSLSVPQSGDIDEFIESIKTWEIVKSVSAEKISSSKNSEKETYSIDILIKY